MTSSTSSKSDVNTSLKTSFWLGRHFLVGLGIELRGAFKGIKE